MTGNATTVDHQLAIDTIRTLAIDGVQQANSGHPGAPMGAAPMAYVLWTRFLRHAPTRPDWFDRDRFVLSAGHASMLLYSLLHLTGYDLPLEELKRFRQLGSRTPGHPEYGLTPGVEATTGPLGQGFANAVGMAIAERRLAAEFEPPGPRHRRPLDVRHLLRRRPPGGHQRRGRQPGRAPAPGPRSSSSTTTTTSSSTGPRRWPGRRTSLARFDAYGWHTQRVDDGNDLEAIEAAIEAARADERPSLIAVRTVIGYGSPNKAGSQKAHGAPLGADEVRLTKEAYGLDPDLTFHIPAAGAGALPRRRRARGRARGANGSGRLAAYAAELSRPRPRSWSGAWLAELPTDWDADLPVYAPEDDGAGDAQRLQERAAGAQGQAAGADRRRRRPLGEQPHRPHGRGRVPGGPARSQHPLRRPRARHGRHRQRHRLPRRPAAVSWARSSTSATTCAARCASRRSPGSTSSYVWTHDSVGLGEDGPTHQPVEHYAALRAMPNLTFVRPGDPNEAVAAWRLAIEHRAGPDGPGADPPEAARPAGHGRAGTRGRARRRLRARRRGRRRTAR